MAARHRQAKKAPEPAFEFMVTQEDQADGGTREAIFGRAIRRTLADQGITGALIHCTNERITVVHNGRIIL